MNDSMVSHFREGLTEIEDVEKFYDNSKDYSYVTFQVFDMEQLEFVIMPMLHLMNVKEYYIGGGLNSNSGYVGHQTPTVTVRMPKKKYIQKIDISLGSFGNHMVMDIN